MNSEEHIRHISHSAAKIVDTKKEKMMMDNNDGAYLQKKDTKEEVVDLNDEEFRREMNTAKISFLAYKHAVHHLNCCYRGTTRLAEEDFVEDQRDEQNFSQSNDDDTTNLELSLLSEQDAKRIVETKAKACFEAVHIANYFNHVREERKSSRNALFRELLMVGQSSSCDNSEDGSVRKSRRVGRNRAVVAKRSQSGNNDSVNNDGDHNKIRHHSDDGNEEPREAIEDITSINKTKKSNNNNRKTSNNKNFIHSDCIRSTMPPFSKGRNNLATTRQQTRKNPSSSYGTTRWIQNVIQWRIQRKIYYIESLELCGCLNCKTELRNM